MSLGDALNCAQCNNNFHLRINHELLIGFDNEKLLWIVERCESQLSTARVDSGFRFGGDEGTI
jgi:hypothetical protein